METSSNHSLQLLLHEKHCVSAAERKGFHFASLDSSPQGCEMLLTVEKQMRITALMKLCLAQALDSNSD